ncbi:MAG: nuclear transport factor 2 family protein [Bacteroidota bacterium]
MHPNAALIDRFYTAFQQRDADGMAACYHPDVVFSDPAFPHLVGDEARAMWAMLCERGTDLVLTYSDVHADDTTGRAAWEATYTFGGKRKVHNRIQAHFRFEDGLIREHRDTFSFPRWARQALGPMGLALGWTPFVQNKVRQQARKGLDRFMAKQRG